MIEHTNYSYCSVEMDIPSTMELLRKHFRAATPAMAVIVMCRPHKTPMALKGASILK